MAVRVFIALVTGFLCFQTVCGAAVFRVDAASTAVSPDGTTWAKAYKDIQAAIKVAAAGDELWVAGGTYTPIAMKVGVNVYGGFAGTEGSRDQRDWSAEISIIDGRTLARCVYGANNATLDGFTVSHGKSTSGGGGMYGGMAVNCTFTANTSSDYNSGGGGMYGGTAINCSFSGNTANSYNGGGGMYGGTATNCTFTGNTAADEGGGMYGGTATNCTFSANSATYGGGMYSGTATNCTFGANSASVRGGGMSDSTATNCTFTTNTAPFGGGMYSGTAINCILWGNSPNEIYGTRVSCSCLSSDTAGIGNVTGNPRFVNPLSRDYRLRTDSPCIDTGSASGAPMTDLLGRTRPQGTGVDMGAFEYYPGDDAGAVDPPAVLRVNTASTATSPDGLTWETAFPTLQGAADGAGYGTEIWVVQGVYAAATGAAVLRLNPGTAVYGGFAGTETARVERGTDNAATVIDGGQVRRCVTADGSSLVDGFTVRYGKATRGGGMWGGAATNCLFKANTATDSGGGMFSGTATSCTFAGNTATYQSQSGSGGGMYDSTATNCTFISNIAIYGGGTSASTATNCTFSKNWAYFGGGMNGDTAMNCMFAANTASDKGGGMYYGTATNCTFTINRASSGAGMSGGTATNCTFTINTASSGGGISGGKATNCILWGNGSDEANGTSITYSCSSSDITGIGNITGNPRFADPLSGNYRLRADSPCIDTGTASGAPATDQLGRTRPQGAGMDMGALEYYPGDDAGAVDPPTVLRVDAASTAASPDGLTWETAYPTLQGAADHAGYGTEIWVVRGVYTITSGAEVLRLNPGTAVYGGFVGTETTRVAQGVDNAATVIDGTKARRCITTSISCLVDGFTVTNGNAQDGGGMHGGTAKNCTFAVNAAVKSGGGMYNGTATDCTFTANTAYSGGGMYNGTATNCTFAENATVSYGGGMYNGTATNCTFSANTAVSYGGAMYYGTATNCTFAENAVSGQDASGGGMYYGTATSSTFAGNTADYGGGMCQGAATNCVFWGNGQDETNGTAVSYSCFSSVAAGVGNITGDPHFVRPLSGDYRLRIASPCIDTGTASGAPATDQLGRTRPQGAGVDMGAFEYCPGDDAGAVDPPAVLRVNAASTAASPDGFTWETAYPTLQSAANHGGYGTEIWVVRGIYTVDAGDAVLRLRPGTAVYGGFVGTETARAARSLYVATTVIDGGQARRCIDSNTTSLVDSFTVKNGIAFSGGGMRGGTAMNCAFAGNTAGAGGAMNQGMAENCTFSGNSATSEDGGGMRGGTAVNCVFTANTAFSNGGGMDSGAATNCTFTSNTAGTGGGLNQGTAENCTFSGNSATSENGGGMNRGTAVNCVFNANTAFSSGGGMDNGTATHCSFSENSANAGGGLRLGTATNCTFTANTANAGAGMYSGTAVNCSFSGNTANYGGGMWSCAATNCIFWNDAASSASEIGGSATVKYSCVQGGCTGVGNIAVDPRFADAARGDLRLLSTSPCIDTGTGPGAPTIDIRGVTRPQGAGFDMGAYEYTATDPTLVIVNCRANPAAGGTVTGPTAMLTGTSAKLTVLVNEGYLFLSAMATSGTITGIPPNLTLSDVTRDTVITVTFQPISYGIAYSVIPPAGGSIAGPTSLATGETTELTVTPNPGYTLASLTASNGNITASAPYILSHVTEDTTVTATFTANANNVAYVASPAEVGSISGPAILRTGDGTVLTVTPNTGYHVVSVLASNGKVKTPAPYVLYQVTADTTVTATFAPNENVITYTAAPPAGGSISGPATMPTGGTTLLTVTPNPGYTLTSLTVGHGSITVSAPYILSGVTADTTVTATFTANSNAVSYVASPSTDGTVTGPATISTGTAAPLTVSPQPGYHVETVSVTNGSVTASAPYELSGVTADTTVTVIFAANANRITYVASPSTGGTVTGPETISTGTIAPLTVSPQPGYRIESVSATNGTVTASTPYELSGVTADTTVTVTFTANVNRVTYVTGPSGHGTVTGPETIATDGTAVVTVAPSAGYSLLSLSASHGSITATAPHVLSGVTENTTVTATFTPNSNAVGYVASPPSGGTVTGPATIATGTAVPFTVSPAPGYHVETVSVTNGSVTPAEPYVLSGVTADSTVTVTFAANVNHVTYAALSSEGGAVTGPETILTGDTAEFVVAPNAGYRIVSVTASNGGITATAPYVLSGVTEDTTVSATFSANGNSVTYVASPTRGGAVTGPTTVPTGTAAPLTVTPRPGYHIETVSATNGSVTAAEPYVLSGVTADSTVTATFAANIYGVTYAANPSEGGTVTGPETIASDETAVVTVEPGTGYALLSLTVSNGSVTATAPHVLSGVTEDTTVTATFALQLVTVPNVSGETQSAASAAITGTGLVTGSVALAHHATVPAGSVVSQDPAAGTQVVPGSAVNLTVSQGPDPAAGEGETPQQVTVPDVSGMSADQAQTTLTGAGLTVSLIEEASDSVAAGQVIRQEPAPGTQVATGTQVSLVVSAEPGDAGCGCSGCVGGKGAFTRDNIKAILGDLFLGALSLMALLTTAGNKP